MLWVRHNNKENMCDVCQYLDLVKKKECQINYCKTCRKFSLAYKSCCASFTTAELEQFHITLSTLRTHHFNYNFMGEGMAIISPSATCVGFCLSRTCANELAESVAESLTIFDVYQVIYK